MSAAARRCVVLAFAAGVVLALVHGLAGGLARAGALPVSSPWMGQALAQHAVLMIGGFFGSVVALERAVALRHPAAFGVPAAASLGAALLLAGAAPAGHALLTLAAAGFVAVNLVLWQRQRAGHTALLAVAAAAWLGAQAAWWLAARGSAAAAWPAAAVAAGFGFLVLTIAAERLEMTRLMRRRPAALRAFWATVAAMVLAWPLSLRWPGPGGVLFGASLLALAAWLAAFDIARRTVTTQGLSRYMAVCLLGGYAWLGAAGLAWVATSLGAVAWRDTALHALGLGFVLSMVMGHAPVILPALLKVKLAYTPAFYLPLGLLHASLVVRVVSGPAWAAERGMWSASALAHALALATFAATLAAAAWRGRPTRPAPRRA
ncbi:hypothetical protein [Ideonella sp.]|uniref:hypothetical protein n=1 Tax=Ideonella sp. TaxID=1929293 RepID=UPI0035B0CAF3